MIKLGCAIISFVLMASTASASTLYEFKARSLSQTLSDFEILFTDLDRDGLLDFDEIKQFSGLTFYDAYSFEGVNFDVFFDVIETVPSIAGFAQFGPSLSTSSSIYDWWWTTLEPITLTDSGGYTFSFYPRAVSVFANLDYQISTVAAVPLPATFQLLIASISILGGFAARRRRQKVLTKV